jgi:bifunctional DNA-binding transcriptional regulator/antitoxin component of YhaV-PrlF toxin-antitoxin module
MNIMSTEDAPKIGFSKKVDEKGRLVIPKEHRQALSIDGRQALSIDGRQALVEFEAKKITYLDDDEEGGGA